MGKDDLSVQIGKKLKQIRLARGLSLDDLSKLTEVSKPMLGQIERGVSNPTVATLWKIASGLQIPFTSFLEDSPPIRTIRVSEQAVLFEDEARYQVFHTSTLAGGMVEVYRLVLLSGCRRVAEAHAHGVIEHVTISSGQLRMGIGDETNDLSAGDAIQFTADRPHTYENPFSEPCVAHLVITYPDGQSRRFPS